jgi:hypothetical protein
LLPPLLIRFGNLVAHILFGSPLLLTWTLYHPGNLR